MDKIEHSEGKFKLIKITIPQRDSVSIITSRFPQFSPLLSPRHVSGQMCPLMFIQI